MGHSRAQVGEGEVSWSAWFRLAREEMAFRYGLRRIPVDRYKTEWALGQTPQQACLAIYNDMEARGQIK